jgi:hypothetical protein
MWYTFHLPNKKIVLAVLKQAHESGIYNKKRNARFLVLMAVTMKRIVFRHVTSLVWQKFRTF